MREIKFRAWDENKKKMHKAFDLTQNPKYWWKENEDYPLMQYTGLKDKNGVEIFEGDILEGYSVYPTGCDFYGHVKGEVYYSRRGTWDCYSFLLGGLNEQLEVIGNIHENPELVEVEE